MESTRTLKKSVKKLYGTLQSILNDKDNSLNETEWVRDNKNRLLNICAALMRGFPEMRLPMGYENPRIYELAREFVFQAGGNINQEICLSLKDFNLTSLEFEFLPTALTLSLLEFFVAAMKSTDIPKENLFSCIRSLILFSEIDFDALREECMPYEKILQADYGYSVSDKQTQAVYRKRINEISLKTKKSEEEICFLAQATACKNITDNLFGADKAIFYESLGIGNMLNNVKRRVLVYVGATMAFAGLLLALLGAIPVMFKIKVLLLLASIAPSIVFSANVINRFVMRRLPLNKPMRVKPAIADAKENKTAVILTVLITSVKDAERALKTIEEYFSGNRLNNGVFGILADLKQSDNKTESNDIAIIRALEEKIEELNKKYEKKFSLIVRERVGQDGVFSGWERKRGAIEMLVDFIAEQKHSFRAFINPEAFKDVKYICTLDADTVVPPDSVVKLLGVLVHPANKLGIYSRSTVGYGLVQPFIGNSPGKQTLFSKIMSPAGGIDAYNAPVKELYNDYFSSGTFCGKGIFSVAGYRALVKNKIQPNTVLSHDLLEGELLGSIGANDVSFLDEYPQNPISYYKRAERWQRGDWQLFPWLFSSLGAVSKWKIFYNLVQSLFSVGIFLQAVIAPFCYIWAYLVWGICLIEIALPSIFLYIDSFRFDKDANSFFDNRINRRNSLKRSLIKMLFLPFEFFMGISAAVKGIWRRCISKKKVLEWNTYASSAHYSSKTESYNFFFANIVLAVIFYFICLWQGIGVILGLLAAAGWCIAPSIADALSREESEYHEKLLPDEKHNLKLLAVRTAQFFHEALEENGYIMPDNLQLKPYKGYAMRTSPTNMGFALLSPLISLKLGLYSPKKCVESIKKQILKSETLEKYNGHFYNWYDLNSSKPLCKYVSTVDSGNYCAALITVLGGLDYIKNKKILTRNDCLGLADAILACVDNAEEDFEVYLKAYVTDFSETDLKNMPRRIREFVNDGILKSCSEVEFPLCLGKYWLENYDNMSFSQQVKAEVQNLPEAQKKTVEELLNNYPKCIAETLNINDFERRLHLCEEASASDESKSIFSKIKSEYRQIYNYAFKVNEDIKFIEKYICTFLDNIDFQCVYNKEKQLFAIGLDTEENKQSTNCYDLLSSEARLTSLIAISLGKAPAEHWFKLSRPFTRLYDMPLCLSWSGTMFEFLMPDIFIKPTSHSMLYNSSAVAVQAQMDFTGKNGIWGVSESGFNALDNSKEYKYKALGVPCTAVSFFKGEKVFSPYSTLLALEYNPRECMTNIVRLVENGCVGGLGFFEAIDYTRTRNSLGAVVYSHMAHHSGMGLCALVNYLHSGFIRKLFGANSFISASKVLLEEKMPLGVIPRKELKFSEKELPLEEQELKREFIAPNLQAIQSNVLGGEEVHLYADSKGMVKAYYHDSFLGEIYVYTETEKLDSFSYEPRRDDMVKYNTVFTPYSVEYSFIDKKTAGKEKLFVNENSGEIVCNITLENKTRDTVKKKVYLVLSPALISEEAYNAHKCFNGLFIQAIKGERTLTLVNRKSNIACSVTGVGDFDLSFATDAQRVLGRGNDYSSPALKFDETVKEFPINPVGALMAEICLEGGEKQKLSFVISGERLEYNGQWELYGLNGTKSKSEARIFDEANKHAHKIRTVGAVYLAEENSKIDGWSHVEARNINKDEWLLALSLGACAENKTRAKNVFASPEEIWKYGISHTEPLLTVLAENEYSFKRMCSVLKAVDFLNAKGVKLNVLIIEETVQDYLDTSFNKVNEFIGGLSFASRVTHIKKGVMNEKEIDKILALSIAKINVSESISEQLPHLKEYCPQKNVTVVENKYPKSKNDMFEGEFDSGYGRFIKDGSEYYVYKKTPMPWSNVLANETFGTLTTENGGGFTWCKNSCLNKLIPWYNDPVTNPLGEGVYLRDNKLNQFWSITRDPVDLGDEHDCVFGHGYSIYRYNGFGMHQKQTVFVHESKNIKVIRVDADETSDRDLSLFYFVRPVLDERSETAFKHQEYGILDKSAVFVRGRGGYMLVYCKNAEFAFSSNAFFGNGTVCTPDAVKQGELELGKDGEILLSLKAQFCGKTEIFVCYGENIEELKELKSFIEAGDTDQWLEDVKRKWQEILSKIQIKTPDRKLNLLFNNWLIYQTLSSRMWGRCGFYQAGGAFGFRDQLQDCLPLIISEPRLVREHLIRCARHQFKEGDVQHWWHEDNLGIRTKISDDLLFLPYIASKYAFSTGDYKIFDETVPFLDGHSLEDREDLFEQAWVSSESATVYEHCMRAIKLVITRSGQHGLPLILGGDWNDGLNKLGNKGKGESVWLGWFLYDVISGFLPISKRYSKEDERLLLEHAKKLYRILNSVCWDGQWYLRAFDDNGRTVGGRSSACCKIDVISQAWSVLSGAGKPEMCEKALESVKGHLIDSQTGIVKLVTPPFTKEFSAGYIGDYLPGVRENGGQYTHGAIWAASAFAQIGQAEQAFEIFDMINPINHTLNKSATDRYKVEPYCVAADVYSNEENLGRGGWTWYTASAGLYFYSVLRDVLGIELEDGKVKFDAHIPRHWNEYSVKIDTDEYKFDIFVHNPENKSDSPSSITEIKKDGKTEIRIVM